MSMGIVGLRRVATILLLVGMSKPESFLSKVTRFGSLRRDGRNPRISGVPHPLEESELNLVETSPLPKPTSIPPKFVYGLHT